MRHVLVVSLLTALCSAPAACGGGGSDDDGQIDAAGSADAPGE